MEQTKDLFGKRLFELRESRGESQQEQYRHNTSKFKPLRIGRKNG